MSANHLFILWLSQPWFRHLAFRSSNKKPTLFCANHLDQYLLPSRAVSWPGAIIYSLILDCALCRPLVATTRGALLGTQGPHLCAKYFWVSLITLFGNTCLFLDGWHLDRIHLLHAYSSSLLPMGTSASSLSNQSNHSINSLVLVEHRSMVISLEMEDCRMDVRCSPWPWGVQNQ